MEVQSQMEINIVARYTVSERISRLIFAYFRYSVLLLPYFHHDNITQTKVGNGCRVRVWAICLISMRRLLVSGISFFQARGKHNFTQPCTLLN